MEWLRTWLYRVQLIFLFDWLYLHFFFTRFLGIPPILFLICEQLLTSFFKEVAKVMATNMNGVPKYRLDSEERLFRNILLTQLPRSNPTTLNYIALNAELVAKEINRVPAPFTQVWRRIEPTISDLITRQKCYWRKNLLLTVIHDELTMTTNDYVIRRIASGNCARNLSIHFDVLIEREARALLQVLDNTKLPIGLTASCNKPDLNLRLSKKNQRNIWNQRINACLALQQGMRTDNNIIKKFGQDVLHQIYEYSVPEFLDVKKRQKFVKRVSVNNYTAFFQKKRSCVI